MTVNFYLFKFLGLHKCETKKGRNSSSVSWEYFTKKNIPVCFPNDFLGLKDSAANILLRVSPSTQIPAESRDWETKHHPGNEKLLEDIILTHVTATRDSVDCGEGELCL